MKNLIFHHIAVVTNNIENTVKEFNKLGYKKSEKVYDPIQNVNICLIEKENSPLIELVEPVNKDSPVSNILQKSGTSPYHLCYQTNDIDITINMMKEMGFIQLQKKERAIAFNKKYICFLYNTNIGLVELVEI